MITPETRPCLATLGGQRTTTKTVRDVYFDTLQHSLMRNDHWLRKRDGVWELKHRCSLSVAGREDRARGSPLDRRGDFHRNEKNDLEEGEIVSLPTSCEAPSQGTDQYREETDSSHILTHLETVFQIRSKNIAMDTGSGAMATVTMDTLLECSTLIPIVEVNFVRECYVIKEGFAVKVEIGGGYEEEDGESCEGGGGGRWKEVMVDLDECECGGGGRYGVGEVEIMVASSDQAQSAAQRCRDIALQLGELCSHAYTMCIQWK